MLPLRKNVKVFLLNTIALFASVIFLLGLDHGSQAKRKLPELQPTKNPSIVTVSNQREAYDVYKSARLWGAQVVHLSRFLNMVEYFPDEESVSRPFPIRTADVRAFYEKGLNSHSWLFIANRTGLVRHATVILPPSVYNGRLPSFGTDISFTIRPGRIEGFSQDFPFTVTTLDRLPIIKEPVIADIDAGYFTPDTDPLKTVEALRRSCPDIRLLVLIRSNDESDVTEKMLRNLETFEAELQKASQ